MLNFLLSWIRNMAEFYVQMKGKTRMDGKLRPRMTQRTLLDIGARKSYLSAEKNESKIHPSIRRNPCSERISGSK